MQVNPQKIFDENKGRVIKCEKSGKLRARRITSADKNECFKSASRFTEPDQPGMVMALEYTKAIPEVGLNDPEELWWMICQGVKDEFYLMRWLDFKTTKVFISGPHKDDFSIYENPPGIVREALQIDFDFSIAQKDGQTANGKTGDFLIKGGEGDFWICDYETYNLTYREIK